MKFVRRPWENFYDEKIKSILTSYNKVIDIGGGLRASKEKGNRFDKKNSWMIPLLEKIDYKILDPVPDYNPDIVGDIHNLPFANESQESLVCIAVLEHVKDPIRAGAEIFRVTKKGGAVFVYVPFLYYYHADKGYYGDYWRFSPEAIRHVFKDFSNIEIQPVRYPFETWVYLSPLGRHGIFCDLANIFDRVFKKQDSQQVSGFYVYIVK
ncbi:class I SAM-dependent methyltransferase [Patescibacteria group bacterium]|nr:class I SAM-dependent methyltransferase [Patescibacteria group bacterium]MBU1612839.1 class I SAM-dependent methyltransferase [Patescibacteria group bacterium]